MKKINLSLALSLVLSAAMMSACSAKSHVDSAVRSIPGAPNQNGGDDGSNKAGIPAPEEVKGHWVSACFTDPDTGSQRQIELTFKQDNSFEHKDTRFSDLGCTQVSQEIQPSDDTGEYKFISKFGDGSWNLELDVKIGENGNGRQIENYRLKLDSDQLYISESTFKTFQPVTEQTVLLENAGMSKQAE